MRSVVVASVIVCASAGSAWAERLVVDDTACGSLELREHVEQILERDPFASDDGKRVSVVVERVDQGIVATVSIGAAPARELAISDCAQASSALAVIIAVALRTTPEAPVAAAATVTVAATVAAAATVLAVPDPAVAPRAAVEARRESPFVGEMSLGLAGLASPDGWMSAALVPGIGVRRGRSSLLVAGEVHVAETIELATMASAHVRQLAVSLTGCRHDLAVALCLVVTGGVVRGRGEGLYDARSVVDPIAGVGGRVGWTYWFGRLGLAAHVDARVNLRTIDFLVDDAVVWSSQRFEAWAGIGVVARIP